MKKFQLLSWLLVAFLAFQFTSCDNEPLEGTFVQGEDPVAAEGEFIAKVDGLDYLAESASGVLTGTTLVITGLKSTSGETITLSVEAAAAGTFNLTAGQTTETFGLYIDSETQTNPYKTLAILGGNGQLIITEMDVDALTVSGSFNFVGARAALDGNGDPILDGNGNPVIETIEITDGSFNTIPYTIDGGNVGENPENSFFANVDGEEFVDTTLEVTQTTVGGIPMLNIVATTETGAIIRIDLPEGLGIGTFSFESISNGTELIAMYNASTGGENLTSSPGTITITEYGVATGRIVATFSFTARDPLGIDPTIAEITDGEFFIDFIDNTSEITDTFEAEVDGEMYEPNTVEVVPTTVDGVPIVFITTEDQTNKQFIRLNFPQEIEVGDYTMVTANVTGEEVVGLFIPDTENPRNFNSTSGTLSIISYDAISRIIEAKFNFIAIDTTGIDPTIYEISNGAFIIQLD